MTTQVWSFGGGTQSAAIAALILQGRLPKPDLAVISDTGREKETTWSYLETVVQPALQSVGTEIVAVKKSDWATVDLRSTTGEFVLIPAFTNIRGAQGKLPAYCSTEWKRRVIQRWLRAQGVKECEVWLGMSVDEMRRVRQSGEGWFRHRYPLIFDVPMRRSECISLVMDQMGWPEPPRSACWMCPQMSDAEWRGMSPEDFAKAVEFEREQRVADPNFYLHESCVPLDQVDFTSSQTALFAGCESGYCFS